MELSASEQQAQMMEAKLQQQVMRFFKFCGILLPVWILGYFGFSFSWLLMALLAYIITSYIKEMRQQRSHAAQQLAQNEQAFLANLDNLPSWVFFPDVERAEWLNECIHQAWPFVRGYATDLVTNSIVPNVKKNLPPYLSSFAFSSLDFGDCSPRIGGIKVYKGESIRRSEIVMDIDLIYFGDCNIEIKWKGFKAGITKLEFRGKMRIVVAPLLRRIPIAGSISMTLLNNPYINFDLTNIGNVLDLPGLRQLLIGAITDQVAALMVLPKRIVIPMAPDLDLSIMRFPLPQGAVRVHIIEARDLEKSDVGFLKKGKSDPYVVAKIGQHKFQTKTIDDNISPVWDEQFEALVHVRSGQLLEIEVFDEDPGSKDDPLGSATVDLEVVAMRGAIDSWIKLDDAKSGSIHVKVIWANLAADTARISAKHSPSLWSSAFLFVEVDSCRGLPSLSKGAEPSALVALSVGGGHDQVTNMIPDSPNPIFEQGFNFFVGNPAVENLNLTVWNEKTDGEKIGELQVRLQSLLGEKQMQLSRSFSLITGRGDVAQVNLRLALRALVEGPATLNPKQITPVSFNPPPPPADSEISESEVSMSSAAGASTSTPKVDKTNNSSNAAASFNLSSSDTSSASDVRYRGSKISTAGLGQLQVTLRYSSSRGTLTVVVHKARDLASSDSSDSVDLYVKLKVSVDGKLLKKHKTKQAKGLSPLFDESFEFSLSETELQASVLNLKVVKVQTFSNQSLGYADIDMAKFDQNSTHWYDLVSSD